MRGKMPDSAFGALAGMLALRWGHTLWRLATQDHAAPSRAISLEWPATVLLVGYVAAVGLCFGPWILETTGAPRLPFQMPLVLAVGAGGVTLRIVGLETLGPAFSFSSRPVVDHLVTTGVYRYLKHPLLIGYGWEITAMLAASDAPAPVLIGVGALSWFGVGAHAKREERFLSQRFGDAWEAYSKRKVL